MNWWGLFGILCVAGIILSIGEVAIQNQPITLQGKITNVNEYTYQYWDGTVPVADLTIATAKGTFIKTVGCQGFYHINDTVSVKYWPGSNTFQIDTIQGC